MSNENKYALIFVIIVGLTYLLSPILMPFLSAGLLAYLGNPLVNWLEERKWSRTLAVTLVFAVIFSSLTAVVIVLVPLIEQQISALVEKLPEIIAWVKQTVLPWLQVRLSSLGDVDGGQLQQTLKDNLGGAGQIAVGVLGSITSSGMAFLSGLATLVLIPVVSFYFLRDWAVMVEKIHGAFPRKMEAKLTIITQEIDAVLAAFFKGQVIVMLCLAIAYYIGFSLAGLEFALLISLILGLVSFVPYLGLIIGLVLACSASVFQLHDGSGILAILIVFTVVQVLESVVLTPVLVGDKIGLHPVAVIFAVMAGGQLFGFTGVLLALPVAAVLLVLLVHLNTQYKSSELYTKM
ncbi:MAG: AI-2E family transporter [Cycloclasticus sp. symbiont of Bathymodiolus heckerae]|nr:MAG: AI-2E family transporter [Cycloclasticus sp. symbiont of Bathymodiolus heckerae]